ncbi:MAG TPA: hypothetical protein VHF88_02435 [Thermoleophilaceae bacterium]|nr:hypothetical protein [Thermoleophilaceae bacterium]
MSRKYKVMLLLAFAIVAFALPTSYASSQEPVEVTAEGSDHCSLIINYCPLELHGESHMSIFGFIISNCEDEFLLELDENGTGFVALAFMDDHSDGGDCTRVRCNGVSEPQSEIEWRITNVRESQLERVLMDVDFCLDAEGNPDGPGTHCNAPLLVSETTGTHQYRFFTSYTCPNGVRIEGSWLPEGSPVEYEHDVP